VRRFHFFFFFFSARRHAVLSQPLSLLPADAKKVLPSLQERLRKSGRAQRSASKHSGKFNPYLSPPASPQAAGPENRCVSERFVTSRASK